MKSSSRVYSRYFSYIKPIAKFPIVKNYAPTIFTLLVGALLLFFAIKPTISTILVLQKKLADSDEIYTKINQKSKDLSAGKTNYDNLSQDIKKKVSDNLPNTVNLKSVILTLEQAARINAATISALQIQPFTIDTKPITGIGQIAEISFVFNVEGDYKNLISLLQNLQTSSRLISIEHLTLSKASDSKVLIMSLSGKTYYLK